MESFSIIFPFLCFCFFLNYQVTFASVIVNIRIVFLIILVTFRFVSSFVTFCNLFLVYMDHTYYFAVT